MQTRQMFLILGGILITTLDVLAQGKCCAIRFEHPDAGKFTIGMTARVIIPVHHTRSLNRPCRTQAIIYACTVFADEKLVCSCELKGTQWVIVASAAAVPVMFVSDSALISHEELHVEDVYESLRRYVERLTSQRFDSQGECHRTAGRESDPKQFVRLMNRFRSQSNDRYD